MEKISTQPKFQTDVYRNAIEIQIMLRDLHDKLSWDPLFNADSAKLNNQTEQHQEL